MKFTTKDGRVWYLHRKAVRFSRNNSRINFYFRKEKSTKYSLEDLPQSTEFPCELPDGYKVVETKTGMPVLKRIPLT